MAKSTTTKVTVLELTEEERLALSNILIYIEKGQELEDGRLAIFNVPPLGLKHLKSISEAL